MEKRVSREGWRRAPKGKTGIVREAGNDNSLHLTPSLAGRWGKERAGRALQATRDTQKKVPSAAKQGFSKHKQFWGRNENGARAKNKQQQVKKGLKEPERNSEQQIAGNCSANNKRLLAISLQQAGGTGRKQPTTNDSCKKGRWKEGEKIQTWQIC